MADTYNSNNIPHSIPGGVVTFKHADGSAFTDAAAGVRTIEEITIDRSGVVVQRPGPSGGAGGFALAGKPSASFPAGKQITANTAIQVPTSTASDIVNLGDYFEINYANAVFRFVITKVSDAFKSEAYYKQNSDLLLDHFANNTIVG